MILSLTILSSIYINKLSKETKNILVDNYNTLDYSRNMMLAINSGLSIKYNFKFFEQNLHEQQKNITEQGEQEITDKLTYDFESIKAGNLSDSLVSVIRRDISSLMFLNMKAIERKNKIAQETADNSILAISFLGYNFGIN